MNRWADDPMKRSPRPSVILAARRPRAIIFHMAYFPQPHYTLRSPRVRISKAPKVVFTLDNTRVEGVLRKLSLTGGLATLARTCSEGALAEVRINTATGHLEALVELLPHLETGGMQPFRFVAMGDSDQELLTSTVNRLRRTGHDDGPTVAGF